MSRVERIEQPSDRRGGEPSRQVQQGRTGGSTRRDDPSPGHNPSKAEGDAGDVEEALERQSE